LNREFEAGVERGNESVEASPEKATRVRLIDITEEED
jgi:hypothetical protein